MGVLKWMRPSHSVASQLNTLIPVGMAMSIVVDHHRDPQPGRHPGDEHVVRPDREPEHEDRHQRERHQPVAEDRFPREDGDDLGGDAESGQHHDVHRRVRVEPEDVLVGERVPVTSRLEEVRVQDAVEAG